MADKKPHIIDLEADKIVYLGPTTENPDNPTRKSVLEGVVQATFAELQRLSGNVRNFGESEEDIARKAEVDEAVAATSLLRIYNVAGAQTIQHLLKMVEAPGAEYPQEVTDAVEELKNALSKAKIKGNVQDIMAALRRVEDAAKSIKEVESTNSSGLGISSSIQLTRDFNGTHYDVFQKRLAALKGFQKTVVGPLPPMPEIPASLAELSDPRQIDALEGALRAFLQDPKVRAALQHRIVVNDSLERIATSEYKTAAGDFQVMMNTLGGKVGPLTMLNQYPATSEARKKDSFRDFYNALEAKARVIDLVQFILDKLLEYKSTLSFGIAQRHSNEEKVVSGLRAMRMEYKASPQIERGLDNALKSICDQVDQGDLNAGVRALRAVESPKLTEQLSALQRALKDADLNLKEAEGNALREVHDDASNQVRAHNSGIDALQKTRNIEAVRMREDILTNVNRVAHTVALAEAKVLEQVRMAKLAQLRREAGLKLLERLRDNSVNQFPKEADIQTLFADTTKDDLLAQGAVRVVHARLQGEFKRPTKPIPTITRAGLVGHLKTVTQSEFAEPALTATMDAENSSQYLLDAIIDCRDAYMDGIITTVTTFLSQQVVAPALELHGTWQRLEKEIKEGVDTRISGLEATIESKITTDIPKKNDDLVKALAVLDAKEKGLAGVDGSYAMAEKAAEEDPASAYKVRHELIKTLETGLVAAQLAKDTDDADDALDKDRTRGDALNEEIKKLNAELEEAKEGYTIDADGKSRVVMSPALKQNVQNMAAEGQIHPDCTLETLGLEALRLYVRAKAKDTAIAKIESDRQKLIAKCRTEVSDLETKLGEERGALIAAELEKTIKTRSKDLIETKVLMYVKIYQELEQALRIVDKGRNITRTREEKLKEIHSEAKLETALISLREAEKNGPGIAQALNDLVSNAATIPALPLMTEFGETLDFLKTKNTAGPELK